MKNNENITNTLYHITLKENLENILSQGLIRNHPDKYRPKVNKHACIYLSKSPYSWEKLIEKPYVILEIDVEPLLNKVHMTQWFNQGLDEVNVWGDIPKELIKIYKIVEV